MRREGFGAAPRIDPEDGAGAIADVERAVGAERQPARDAEIGRHHLVPSVVEHAIDAAFETRSTHTAVRRAPRHRGGVDEAVHERLARAVAGDPEDRHGRFLPARAAIGDVEMTVGAEDGVVDLMQAGREQRRRRARRASRPAATRPSRASRRRRGRPARRPPCDPARQTPCAPDTPPIVTRSAVESGWGNRRRAATAVRLQQREQAPG